MDKKEFFENIRKEANEVLSKVFDKVEEVSKVSVLKLKIGNLKSKIKTQKMEIGEFVFSHKSDFENFEKLRKFILKIEDLDKMIEEKEKLLADLKENEEAE